MELVKDFQLLPPEKLPVTIENVVANELCTQAIDSLLSASGDELVSLTAQALQLFDNLPSPFTVIENDENETQHNRDNDAEFFMYRVQGNTMEVLVYTAINAYRIMLADMAHSGTSLNEHYFNVLQKSFFELFRFYKGVQLGDIDSEYPKKSNFSFSQYCDSNDSYQRWVHGHFVFMVIIQGLVVSLNCFCREVDRQQYRSANNHLKRAALLMTATEAAMHYTGEFSQQAYIDRVRPTLIPPIAQPNMSGIHWRDHEYMVKNNFIELKAYLHSPNKDIAEGVTQFRDAVGHAYVAHKQVCGKFVGDAQSSLLSSAPAVSVLDKYRKARLKVFGQEKRKES
jgi:hypothetical protein